MIENDEKSICAPQFVFNFRDTLRILLYVHIYLFIYLFFYLLIHFDSNVY